MKFLYLNALENIVSNRSPDNLYGLAGYEVVLARVIEYIIEFPGELGSRL